MEFGRGIQILCLDTDADAQLTVQQLKGELIRFEEQGRTQLDDLEVAFRQVCCHA